MTISTTSSNLNKLNEEVLELTTKYKNSSLPEDLNLLISKTFQFTTLLRKYEFNHNNRVLEDFDEDVCLEYLGMILSDRTITDPRHKLRGIISKRIYQHNTSSTYNIEGMEFFGDYSTINYLDTKLFLNDVLISELDGLQPRIKSLIMYYTINFKLMKNFVTFFPNKLEKFVVVLKVYEIRKKMMNEAERTFDITFSKNRIANLLLLSGLFNESPEMFVLLTLLGDFKKFLTFISLFEGKNINVPKVADVNAIFSKSSVVAQNFENKSVSIKDRENLLSLVTNVKLEDVTPDTKITKFLEDYLSELVLTSMENYGKVQDRHLKSIDFTNSKKVREAYSIVDEEMSSATNLLSELFSTMATSKDINNLITQIKQTNNDQK